MSAIEVTGLRKRYGDVEAVRGVDLSVDAGEVFALLGPNGAGKTTIVEILEGFRDRSAIQWRGVTTHQMRLNASSMPSIVSSEVTSTPPAPSSARAAKLASVKPAPLKRRLAATESWKRWTSWATTPGTTSET